MAATATVIGLLHSGTCKKWKLLLGGPADLENRVLGLATPSNALHCLNIPGAPFYLLTVLEPLESFTLSMFIGCTFASVEN
jgi:hypothetical protein